MASSRLENLWLLISKHNFEIRGNSPYALMCSLCKKLLTDAYVATCGCQFCGGCIRTYLANEKRKCVGTSPDCKVDFLEIDKTVLPDYTTRLNLAKVIVKCPYNPCTVATELSKMDDHILVCRMVPKSCPYEIIGCTEKVQIGTLVDDHLRSNALIHSQLLFEANKSLKTDVDKLKEIVEKNTIELDEFKNEKQRNNREIDDLKKDSKRNETLLIEEIEAAKRCLLECVDKIKMSENESGEDMTAFVNRMKCDLDREWDRRNSLKEVVLNIERRVKTNEDQIDLVKNDIYTTTRQLLNRTVKHDFVWMINQFSGRKGWHESEAFVKDDYKLCIGACVASNHLYLYLNTMKGDKDDSLQWPMPHIVTLTIVNQNSMTQHKSDTYKFDATESTSGTIKEPPFVFGRPPLPSTSDTIAKPRKPRDVFEPFHFPNHYCHPNNTPSFAFNAPNPSSQFSGQPFGSTSQPLPIQSPSYTPFPPINHFGQNKVPRLSNASSSKSSSVGSCDFGRTQNIPFVANRTDYNIWSLWISLNDLKNIPGLILNDSIMVCCYLDKGH